MQQLELFLRARHGVAGYGTLSVNGFSRQEIERAVNSGSIRRIARGTFEALVLAESAVARDAVGLKRLRQEFTGQRDWPVLGLLDSVRRTTASPLEVCARFHLLAAGIQFKEEVLLLDVGRVDFLIDGWLIVEIDGYAFHSGRVEYRKDRQRWNGSSSGGWITLRITAETILHQPDVFIGLVIRTRDGWADTAPRTGATARNGRR